MSTLRCSKVSAHCPNNTQSEPGHFKLCAHGSTAKFTPPPPPGPSLSSTKLLGQQETEGGCSGPASWMRREGDGSHYRLPRNSKHCLSIPQGPERAGMARGAYPRQQAQHRRFCNLLPLENPTGAPVPGAKAAHDAAPPHLSSPATLCPSMAGLWARWPGQ